MSAHMKRFSGVIEMLVSGGAPYDVSLRQMATLLMVADDAPDAPKTIRGIAGRLKVPKPSITRAVDTLSEYGLAERRPDPKDRRSILVYPTKAGTTLLARIDVTLEVGA